MRTRCSSAYLALTPEPLYAPQRPHTCGWWAWAFVVRSFFCEKNMMALFWEILQADCGTEVRVQIIQTVSILLQNVRNPIWKCTWLRDPASMHVPECVHRARGCYGVPDYMLSNNHVNNLITANINPHNEEVMSYYISFLKTMSLQLTEETVQFFYNEVRGDAVLSGWRCFFPHGDDITIGLHVSAGTQQQVPTVHRSNQVC